MDRSFDQACASGPPPRFSSPCRGTAALEGGREIEAASSSTVTPSAPMTLPARSLNQSLVLRKRAPLVAAHSGCSHRVEATAGMKSPQRLLFYLL